MIDKALLARVKLVNQLPLNKAAAQWLEEPPLATEPAVLTLMRWGLENGVTPQPLAPGHPDGERMMAQINAMTEWEPRLVMKFLTNPEGLDDDAAVLYPHQLDDAEDAQEAAAVLLESLYDAMVATSP